MKLQTLLLEFIQETEDETGDQVVNLSIGYFGQKS